MKSVPNERVAGVGGGEEAFAAAGEEEGVADFFEGLSIVDVNGGVDWWYCSEKEKAEGENWNERFEGRHVDVVDRIRRS